MLDTIASAREVLVESPESFLVVYTHMQDMTTNSPIKGEPIYSRTYGVSNSTITSAVQGKEKYVDP